MLDIYLHPELTSIFTIESKDFDPENKLKTPYVCGNGIVYTDLGFKLRTHTLPPTPEEIEGINAILNTNLNLVEENNRVKLLDATRPLDEPFDSGTIQNSTESFEGDTATRIEVFQAFIEEGIPNWVTPTNTTSIAISPTAKNFEQIVIETLTELTSNKDETIVINTESPKLFKLYNKFTDPKNERRSLLSFLGSSSIERCWEILEPLMMKIADRVTFRLIDKVSLGVDILDNLNYKAKALINVDKFTAVRVPNHMFKFKTTRSGLLTLPRMYSLPVKEDDWILLSTGNELGRAVPDLGLAIVKLNNPDGPVDNIQRITKDLELDEELLHYHMQHIYQSRIAGDLDAWGHQGINKNETIYGYNDIEIFNIIEPPMMTLEAVKTYDLMIDNAKRMVSETPANDFTLLDITKYFYDVDDPKHPLLKSIPMGTNEIKVDTKEGKFKLRLGNQLPDRNGLNRLKGEKFVGIWINTKETIRHYFITIVCDEGRAVFFNPYINMKLT